MGWSWKKTTKSKQKQTIDGAERKKKPRSKTFVLEEIISPSVVSCPIIPIDDSLAHIPGLGLFTQEELVAAILGNNSVVDINNIDTETLFEDYFAKIDEYLTENPTEADAFDVDNLSTWPTLEALINPGQPSVEIPDIGGAIGTLPPPMIIPVDPPAHRPFPGDVKYPATTPPTVPRTSVDQGANDLSGTQVQKSEIEDIIDQVSVIDPVDIYRGSPEDLAGSKLEILSGSVKASFVDPSGQVLSQQVLSKGTHTLAMPANPSEEVLLKIERNGSTDGTYVLQGFQADRNEAFNIDLEFETPLSASQKSILQEAARSVANLVAKGLPSAIVDGQIIDDIKIKVSAKNLDGIEGTQARTKIDFMRYGTLLPAQSITEFDAADVAHLEQTGELFSVAQHEFLHALGFGNLWEAKGLVDYAGTPLAQYNGQNAVAAFQKEGGLTDRIALETEGDGSAGLHWHEGLFQDEVMTADANLGSDGEGKAPVSTVTLASLADLGYDVNLEGATSDYELLGGQGVNTDNFTPEQIEAFRELAETSFGDSNEEFIYAVMPEVDPDKIAPEIWAHAERFWKNGEYYDWKEITIGDWWAGHTISDYAYKYMTHSSKQDHRSASQKANDPEYWAFISNRNGFPNPNWIVKGNKAKVPVWHPNYEWKQEQERRRREAELRRKQEEEERRRREEQERLARDKAEQERKQREEEERQREAERLRRELEEQERRLREEKERRRQEEERRKEEERLRELERQREIARQQGKGGQDWFFATTLPEFGPVDPFETKLSGETVGNLVPDDYYRFTLSRKGRIDARLMNLLADADLVLYDVRNRPISYSMREGITDEQILVDLIPGTYMLRVNSPEGVTTDYDLIVKFKHLLSQTELGPPPGWRVGGGTGGGGGVSAPLFSDPRIMQIYNTALNNFSSQERAKANTRIADLEREKRGYEQDLEALLNQMNAEQRAKVHRVLDDGRHSANIWVDNIANPIKNKVDNLANGIINRASSFADSLENKVNQVPDYGIGWVKDRKNNAKWLIQQGRDAVKGAVNSAQSWLKGKLAQIQDGVKSAIWHFFETIKKAYRTGAEINQIIANAAQTFRNTVDGVVRGANDLIGEFKGKVLSAASWTKNLGVHINQWPININFDAYHNIVEPAVNSLVGGFQSVIGGIGNSLKGIVNWIEPRTQDAVEKIVNALFGDKTAQLWNEIHGVDAKIAATRTELERKITQKASELKNQLQGLLNNLGTGGKKILDILMGFANSPGGQVSIEVIKVILGMILLMP